MITHTVLFRLARPADPAVRAVVVDAVERFAADPPHALAPARVLLDAGLRDEGRSVSEAGLVVTFADPAGFGAYLADDRHLAFVADVLERHCESWLSLQSEG